MRNMRVIVLTLFVGWLSALACGGNPPPAVNQLACDRLKACNISSDGFSCSDEKVSACAQCINGSTCGDILAGACAPPCPGVKFKPK